MKKYLAYLGLAFSLPALAFAQITSAQTAATFVINFINTIAVPVLFAIAFLVFIWGIFQTFIMGRGNEEAQQTGRTYMLYGIIGFVLMVSVWGLVNILLNTFQLNNQVPHYPSAPYGSN